MELTEVLSRLKGVQKTGAGYLAFCPTHDDRIHRSLSVAERDGKVLIHCFVGCSYGDILDSLGYSKEIIIPSGIIEDIYDYTDKDDQLLYQVVRYYPKTFKQRRPDGGGGYIWDLKGITLVLYQLPQVLKAVAQNKIIYIVEGEKDCKNLGIYDLTSTTCAGGANAPWQPQYTEALKDARVGIIPDNDVPGRKYAEKISSILYGWTSSLKLLELGIKDVTEWLRVYTSEELEHLTETTSEYTPKGAVTREEYNTLKGHLIYLQKKFQDRLIRRESAY